MKTLLVAGLLYILVIAIVLAKRPAFMFTEDGNWKEFGVNRDTKQYTVFPFWMFCILSAILCFFVVTFFGKRLRSLPEKATEVVAAVRASRSPAATNELKPGIYMLNAEKTAVDGVPKYIYIGDRPPLTA